MDARAEILFISTYQEGDLMSQKNVVVIGSAEFDLPTRYLHAYLNRVIQQSNANGVQTHEIKPNEYYRNTIEQVINQTDPAGIILGSHGSDDRLGSQNNSEMVLEKGLNEHITQGSVVYAFSCLTSRQLGPATIQAGAISYVGYDEEFVWIADGGILNDPYARPCMLGGIAPAIALVNGGITGDAYLAGINEFNKQLNEWRNSNDPSASEVRSSLAWDRDHLVLNNDQNAAIVELAPGEQPAPQTALTSAQSNGLNMAILVPIALIALFALASRSKKK